MKQTEADAVAREPITDPNTVAVVLRDHMLPADLANQVRALKLTLALVGECRLVADGRDVGLADLRPDAVGHCLASTTVDVARVGAALARIAAA
jgi:hypothetical protein